MHASSPTQVRWATNDDLADLDVFWRESFGPDSVQATPGRAAWLFGADPAAPAVAVASADGRIVAACGHVVQDVELPGVGTVQAAFGVDFMVAPDWRRRGLGREILDLRLDRYPLSLSTGQSAGMASLYCDQGAVDLGSFLLARYLRRPQLGRGPRALVRDMAALACSLRSGAAAAGPTSRRPADLAAAGNAWLTWRFQGPVYRDYEAWEITRGSASALAVTRPDGDRDVLAHLEPGMPRHEALTALAAQRRARVLDALFCGRALAADFRAAGYLVRPWGARLIAASRRVEIRDALAPGCLDLFASAADADLLRRP